MATYSEYPDCGGKDPKCFRCDGTGLICDKCGESEAACRCEAVEYFGSPDGRELIHLKAWTHHQAATPRTPQPSPSLDPMAREAGRETAIPSKIDIAKSANS